MKKRLPSIDDYVDRLLRSNTLYEAWTLLLSDLECIGFDRALYGRKPRATAKNFHNHADTLIFSSYGSDVDKLFVEARGYTSDVTTNWVLAHEGAVSWSVSREKYLRGEMSAGEAKVHLATRSLNLVAGMTYGLPLRPDGARAGFGLAFCEPDQKAADAAWGAHRQCIVPRLQAFELAVTRIPHIPPQYLLRNEVAEVLALAAEGKTISEIGALLGLHRRTVDDRMAEARRVFGVSTTLQAVLRASEQGQLM